MDENKWMKTTYSVTRNKLDTPALKNLIFFPFFLQIKSIIFIFFRMIFFDDFAATDLYKPLLIRHKCHGWFPS